MKKTKKKIPAEILEKCAKDFGRTLRTVRDWARTGAPISSTGYDKEKLSHWLASRRVKKPNRADFDSEAHWRAEFRKYKAELARLEFEEKQKNLVPYNQAEKWAHGILVHFKERFLAYPRRGAGELFGKEPADIEILLRKNILDIFSETYFLLKRLKDESKAQKTEPEEVALTYSQTATAPAGDSD